MLTDFHGPNTEGYTDSMSTLSGTNLSGVKTSMLVDIYSFVGKATHISS
jgi:hypothetical protein